MHDPTAPRSDDPSPRGHTASGPAGAYPGGVHDEMRGADGAVREGWAELAALVDRSRPAGLAAATRRLLADEGVIYRPPGEHEQPWALDPLPLPLTAATWVGLEAGVAQRALLLDRLLADLYGPRLTLRTGLLPVEVVLGHPGFVHGWARATPRPRELFLAGTDLVRTPEGWRVLGDRVQAPSGAGYALANRRIVSRVLASVRRDAQIRRLGPFFDAMRRGLEELAPAPDRARVVLLTPGPRSETAYEQALLASRLGFPLVLASELTVREGRVWQRTMGGSHDGGGRLEPVDVILRRVDAAWCDPLDLRQDSHLGVPGLLEAARLGTVAVVNGLGSGVAENPGLLPFLPAAARALLDEPLALPGAPTWWCGEAAGRSHVLAHLADLLVKPIARGEGRATVDGAALTTAERAELAARIEAEPHAWIGQEPQRQSTAPVVAGDALDAAPLVLRTFAVAAGGAFRVLAGGLAEAGTRGATVAKDVWVSGATVSAPAAPAAVGAAGALSPRVAADLFWLGRYAERAEGTARLLRAVADRFADFRSTPEPAGGEALDVLLRAATAATTTPQGTPLHALITDRELPGSLAYAVHRLTGAAQAVREQLSTDTWLVLGRLETVLAEVTPAGDVSAALSQVLEGLLALAGLAAESHVRDPGWHLTDAGRRLERAQHVAALVAATLCAPGLPAADGLVQESVLIAAESLITARRRPHTGLDSLLELLITDPDNPRSIGYQADRLRQDVAHVPGPDGGVLAALVAVEQRLAELRPADLVHLGPDGTRDRLRSTLLGIGGDLTRFAEVLEGARFAPGAPPRPLGPVAVGGGT